jgi:DNA-binding LytR/AlgR family response regulator
MNTAAPTALIVDDEPLLRRSLVRLLGHAWPELRVVAEARSGREALERCRRDEPDVCFLDIHMPGLSGLEVARQLGPRTHVVFVTAYDRHAVEAFEQGAVDYLVKPVEPSRLSVTVARLKERLAARSQVRDLGPVVERVLHQIQSEASEPKSGERLRWLRVSSGKTVRVVEISEVDYMRSEDKYTLVAWRDETARPCEGLVRTPLKELLPQLDSSVFVQVHRSAIVNLHAVSQVVRDGKETATLHFRHRKETLPVSRTFLHLFHQM